MRYEPLPMRPAAVLININLGAARPDASLGFGHDNSSPASATRTSASRRMEMAICESGSSNAPNTSLWSCKD